MNTLLAGPILRRTEATRVCIWLATSTDVRVRAHIFDVEAFSESQPKAVGAGSERGIQLGANLFVHLVEATPKGDSFPRDRLLGYDIELLERGARKGRRLGDLDLLDGLHRIAYDGFPLPTFYIRNETPRLRLMHGSCRMLHGKGHDALSVVDEVLARHAHDVNERPSALFLTGDQIYGDEVAGPMIDHIRKLATELMGPEDEKSVPDWPALTEIPVNGRAELAHERAKLTSGHAENHLMSFGEFAATYVVAWNPDNWPDEFAAAADAIPDDELKSGLRTRAERRKYAVQRADLSRTRATIPRVRRALANIPTYMIFDDHDCTDDWNLTLDWHENVRGSASGRRMVANALASYWAFQGWGNRPDSFDDTFKKKISAYMLDQSSDASEYEDMLWDFNGWYFCTPTDPPTIFLDSRTNRTFDSGEGAAHLIGELGRKTALATLEGAGYKPGDPLIVVSPVPIFGLELQERRQKFLKDKVGPYEIDLEAWHSNLQGLVEFMEFIMEDLQLESCVFLSGDVHYGMNLKVTFRMNGRELRISQIVSSSFKHSGVLSKVALNLLGKSVRRKHERVGWKSPPESARTGIRALATMRPANTDEWSPESPVMLSPRRAKHLHIEEEPDFSEEREYIVVSGDGSLKIVGENNVGLVTITRDEVVHEVLCPTRRGLRVHTARLPAI
ncbi:MAG: hypothetical protein ACRDJV_11200 [Actinomycetota bacterium]